MKLVAGDAHWTRDVLNPRTLFRGGAIVAATVAVLAALHGLLPREIVLPVIATGCFVLAAVAAVAAKLRAHAPHNGITLWDVAGALTFIGIFASALIAPEQLVQIIEGSGQRD